ncbi:MAG: membrane protein [Phycisphaerae bacterium]|jgi:lipopolysaccharide export LptBFGC system permease protein LptF
MRILDRYILKSFFTNYLLSLFVLMSLYVVLDLFVNFDEFTEAGKPILAVMRDIGDYYFFNTPLYFAQLSGVITLFAACGTLARLQRANEMTAFLASGTSLYRLAAPIVLAGLVMNGLLVANHELLLPQVAAKLARNRDDVAGARTYELWFVKDGPDRLISAAQFKPSEQRIRGLYIMELEPGEDGRRHMGDVIRADKAKWDPVRKGWELTVGKRYRLPDESSYGRGLEPLTEEAFYASTLTPEDLLLRKMAQWVNFLSLGQLQELVAREPEKREQVARIRHGRFTAPINNMILLLLGISFFLNRLPESVLTQGAKSLAVCSASFLIAFIGHQLMGAIGAGALPDWLEPLPAWLPIFLFGPVAVVLLDNVKT